MEKALVSPDVWNRPWDAMGVRRCGQIDTPTGYQSAGACVAGFLHLPDPLGRNIVLGVSHWVPYTRKGTSGFSRTSRLLSLS